MNRLSVLLSAAVDSFLNPKPPSSNDCFWEATLSVWKPEKAATPADSSFAGRPCSEDHSPEA
jgi:hypothetical protein